MGCQAERGPAERVTAKRVQTAVEIKTTWRAHATLASIPKPIAESFGGVVDKLSSDAVAETFRAETFRAFLGSLPRSCLQFLCQYLSDRKNIGHQFSFFLNYLQPDNF